MALWGDRSRRPWAILRKLHRAGASAWKGEAVPERMPELLAPAGGYRALLAALAAGADAVYTGLSRFSARASAEGLSMLELERGAALAHARGARVYVAMNIALYDDELDDAVSLASRALAAGADALIVADLGLIARLRAELPEAELHLSTQAGVHAPEAVRLAARELGVERVTVARELPLDEVAELCSEGVPIECFVHGAICIGYSGACAFSALRRGRSALRGDCTQPCRLSYALEDEAGELRARAEGDKLLCPKDYLGIGHVAKLARARVASLKIEGRMKNPDYVYNVVRCYRAALDAVAEGAELDVPALERELARSFNRGFTDAYLRGESGAELMSFERSSNQGVRVGQVVTVRREECDVSLNAPVSTGDMLEIRFYPGKDAPADVPKRWPQVPCPADAAAGEVLTVRCKRKISAGCAVYLIRSAGVLAEAEAAVGAMETAALELASKPASSAEPPAEEGLYKGRHQVGPGMRCEGADSAYGDQGGPERVTVADDPDMAQVLLGAGEEVAVCAWRIVDDSAWNDLVPRLTVLLDEMLRPDNREETERFVNEARRVVCRNIAQVELAHKEGRAFDAGAPVFCTNAWCAAELVRLGVARIWLVDELSAEREREMRQAAVSIGFAGAFVRPVARERELMVCEHCMLTAEGPCAHACAACPRRAECRFLVERDGTRLPVRTDVHGRSRIFLCEDGAGSPDTSKFDRIGELPNR